jgi:hypothetical protein
LGADEISKPSSLPAQASLFRGWAEQEPEAGAAEAEEPHLVEWQTMMALAHRHAGNPSK